MNGSKYFKYYKSSIVIKKELNLKIYLKVVDVYVTGKTAKKFAKLQTTILLITYLPQSYVLHLALQDKAKLATVLAS